MRKIVLGFDFGTLSCRGVAVDLQSGVRVAQSQCDYAHGVIAGCLPDGGPDLPDSWFLQDPDDWMNSLTAVCRDMLTQGGIMPEEVTALGIDFTSCTLVPIKADGTPLCTLEAYRRRPHAWPKLWKHHGAQKQADRIEALAREETDWLSSHFGNSVSSEWAYPKMMQVAEEAPDIYEAADYFIEAVDYIPMVLTGRILRNNGVLGVNAFYIEGRGYPDETFAAKLNPLMRHVAEDKLAGEIGRVGDAVGCVRPEMAVRLGITDKVVVSVGNSDGAVAGCGVGANESGTMMLVMGTSTCHQFMYRDFHSFDGLCSIAADGMVPGLYGYESGQSATGDIFAWYVDSMAPESVTKAAAEAGLSPLEYLGREAEKLLPGECGLMGLDWLNGNRSILSNYDLSGCLLGLTLNTSPVEIYRALVEANIYGSRRILDNYEENGITISTIFGVGGIAVKCPWIMQMCADVFNKPVRVPLHDNVPALGSAATAAVALFKSGDEDGCDGFGEAASRLIPGEAVVYEPDPFKAALYRPVYELYRTLHDLFGVENSLMKELRALKHNAVSMK
ncbi:MAG: ribulokinase [Lachnospiraceae bacterium]|nr:ribulokinase [Lachnospiraceae bacterium]